MKDSSHWYDKDGKAVFEVPYKDVKKGMRPTRLPDAVALKLFPSVTTILNVLAKPSLDRWKLEQVANACRRLGTDQDNAALIDAAFEQVADAADLGTSIHKAIEDHYQTGTYDPNMGLYVEAVDKWVVAEGVKFTEHELRLVSLSHGFAGTTDAVITSPRPGAGILDFKSRKTQPGKKVVPYETQPMQIAAYYVVKFGLLPDDDAYGCNVYISTTEPGRIDATWYTGKQLREEWVAFLACRDLWIHLNGYDPRFSL
jgi:hypothetical protein